MIASDKNILEDVSGGVAALYAEHGNVIDVTAPIFVLTPEVQSHGMWTECVSNFGHVPLPIPYASFFIARTRNKNWGMGGAAYIGSWESDVHYYSVKDNSITIFYIRGEADPESEADWYTKHSKTLDLSLLSLNFFDEDVFKNEEMLEFCSLTTLIIALHYLKRLKCPLAIGKITSSANRASAEKRLRKGKRLPYFSYNIVRPNEFKIKNSVNKTTHASPRFHARRGHIRHLKSGAQVIVSQCMVGDLKKGLVIKDYIVS